VLISVTGYFKCTAVDPGGAFGTPAFVVLSVTFGFKGT